MNTGYKALLKKGALAIFISAFVGIVYASQRHGYVHLPKFISRNFLPIDSPPPDTSSVIDTRTAPPIITKPQNDQNDTGSNPPANPNGNVTVPNNSPSNLNPGSLNAPNSNNPVNSVPNNLAAPPPGNPASPNSISPTQAPIPPVPTPTLKETTGQDTTKNKAAATDTSLKLHYPIAREGESPKSSFDFTDPLKKDVEIDSSLNTYTIKHKAGNTTVGDSQTESFKQYQADQNRQWMQDYFKKRSEAQVATQKGGLLPKLNLNTGTPLDDLAKLVKIEPNGSATLIFSEDFSRVQNPTYSLNEQRNAQFKFDQKIQVSVVASIGDRIKMNFRYDTQASFDFENQKKLSYQGKEDDILQSIDVGDVSFPVSGTLITGSQSLFGVKTKLKFGKLDVNAIFAQEKSDQKSITLQGGAQVNTFKITADNYDANRNYFLAQYFVNHYDQYNAQWPALSNIQITKVELWVTNLGAAVQNTRTVAAFMDLGESEPYNNSFLTSNNRSPLALPGNNANTLYRTLKQDSARYRVANNIANSLNTSGGPRNFISTRDYYILQNARELQPNEYTLNSKLGYISLNQQLNPGDMLGVAFQYTLDGKTYQVGEFAEDVPPNSNIPNVLYLKMLKSVVIDSHVPDWNLMMKNIYSLGTYQISPTNFKFQVVYDNSKTGAYLNYLPEPEVPGMDGTPIIRLLGMDKVNSENQPKPDGQFDYIEGVTVISSQGKIIFPVLQPFGKDLKKLFGNDTALASQYVYQLLYDSTHTFAVQDQTHNKYFLEGQFQGTAGNVISLNSINVPQGSVKVTANGVPLTEGTDYTVDYNLGRVTIINQSVLNSGAVINVTSESQSLFSIQQKTLMGTHLDYHFDKKFTMGGTFLYLNERPLTTKVNIGEEPVSNAIFGFDGHYNTDSKMLTDLVNKIPLIQTKEKSTFTAEGEYAQIIPGHPAVLNQPGQNGGVSYVDDFEGSIVPYDLRLGYNWTMASCPQGQPSRFPEASKVNDLSYGYHRAKTAWYVIDNTMFENIAGTTPPNIIGNNTLLSDPMERMVQETEVFPNEQIAAGTPDICQTFDVYYNPKVRGPYNYNPNGLDPNGNFLHPDDNWGGLQRSLPITDFLDANIQYIELWMLDPYNNPSVAMPQPGTGTMEVDLGTVSEDILHDDRESWENGLTCDGSSEDVTVWGRVPNGLHITTAFDIDPTTRPCQDVGYDGLSDDSERVRFAPFLAAVKGKISQAAWNGLNNDPSGDNFHFWRGTDYDAAGLNVVQRYIQMNGVEGNTPISIGGDNGYGSLNPDDEDINHDFNVETSESYYEYEIKIDEPDLKDIGRNYVTDEQNTVVTLPNGTQQTAKWLQFKIPIEQFTRAVGSGQDLTSIRFMRIYMTGFNAPVLLRFARLQLVRGDWRKYLYSLDAPGDPLPTDTAQENLDVSAISIETDAQRPAPSIKYVIPPGIQRQIDYSTPSLVQQNEQSLDLKICGLKDGESRAVYKNVTLDLRQYKNLQMFVHCEAEPNSLLKSGDLHMFIRLGLDYTANYYELDEPLEVTPPNGSGNVDATWPTANQIALAIQQWVDMKTNRNVHNGSLTVPYTVGAVGTAGELTVLGNPDLGNVRTIMIGLRHPKGDDKGPTPCAEVWVDELRMSGFNEKGGWAATTRVLAKLADFGRVELSASKQTIGFGSIDQSLQQRNIQDMTSFGVITSINLDKFFPKKYGVVIPMFFAYSQQLNTPEYNPLSPDQQLATLTSLYHDPAKQDSVIQACEDFTARKSLNFTGVHKERKGGTTKKTHIYDIENFNATYIYSEIDRHDITSIYNNEITWSGQLTYRYDFKPKSIDPFKSLNSKYLKILHDINFYYLPQNLSIIGKIDRDIQEQLYRNTADYQTINLPMYNKVFTFTRKYDFRYNLSTGLRLTYSSTALALINEPDGLIDSAYKRQIILNNILHGGVPSNFVQSVALDYDVPINKLPFLDWTSLHANYTANYQWTQAPPIAAQLGNVAQNSQSISLNGQLNFLTIYNKSKYLRNIISGRGNAKEETKKDTAKQKGPLNIKGRNMLPQREPQAPTVSHLSTEETLLGIVMSVRSVMFTYSQTNGTALPGFLPSPQHFGENFDQDAPGIPFILGSQADIREKAARNGWITNDTNLSQQYITNHRESLVGSANLEPLKDLKIKVDFNRTSSSTFSETYRYIDTIGANGGVYSGFAHLSPVETGNYSISIISFASAFKSDGPNNTNTVFQNFMNDRKAVAFALARATPGYNPTLIDSGFPRGYSKTHQDVLIPAFLQAYAGMKTGTNEFPQIPAPNWSINYTGLSNYPFMKAVAKQVTISSGYHSTYSVSSYTSNLYYDPLHPTFDTTGNNSANYNSKYLIQGVTISERFDPLIGIDVTLKNNWSGAISFGKERQETLTFVDQRVTENKTSKITLGVGYITNKLYLPFTGRTKRYLKNEFKFRLDVQINQNEQEVRILDQPGGDATGGQLMVAILPNITYTLNKNLTLNIFLKRDMTTPYTSNQFPTSLTSIGFSIKYVLTP